MNKFSIVAITLGAVSLASSAALYLTRQHHVAPVINVQPAPVTVQQAPAPVVNVQTPLTPPAPAPAPVAQAPAAPERPAAPPSKRIPKAKKKPAKKSASSTLHTKWSK